jgi:RNA polymerase sigma-70 factor (ECF subfamily)
MDFFQLYDEYYIRVRKFILASVRDEWVADDLTQEAFVRIQKNLDGLKDSSKVSSWIFRIAYNLCQDHFRSRKKSSSDEHEFREEMAAHSGPLAQKELEQGEMGDCVRNVVNLLPESLRTVIVLYDMMDCRQQEIAEILGTSVENVKVRLHRARKKLKVLLQERCTFEVDERSVLVCDPLNAEVKKRVEYNDNEAYAELAGGET